MRIGTKKMEIWKLPGREMSERIDGLGEIESVTIFQRKKEIRSSMLEARSRLLADELTEKSAVICRKLLELPEFNAAKLVMTYMDFRNEVNTREFIRESIRRGKRIALPVVLSAKRNASLIAAYEVHDLESCIRKGSYGICEPDIENTYPVLETDIDMIVVPGVAFDCCRRRIGYGAGYYDRFLKKLRPDCISIGLSFEIQLTDELPCEEHDSELDMIITESRIFK